MAKKVPVTVFVDPTVESEFSIKPFAAGLASKAKAETGGSPIPEGVSGSVTATNAGAGKPPDVDADVDYTDDSDDSSD